MASSVLAVVLTTLAVAGCGRTSERAKPTDATSPTATAARAGIPKLVDLGATQCVPCKMMAPILEELEREYAGVMDVQFIDVWKPENKETARSYGIEEIPTQVFLDPEGEELWRHTGFIAKEDILAKWSELGYDLKPGSSGGNADIAMAAESLPTDQNNAPEAANGPSRISVFYLFNTFRCAACKKVESLTKEAVLGTAEEPSPFADEIAAGKMTFENLNIEEKQHEHFLTDFGTQAKIPVVAEMAGNRIVRFTVLDQSWFLFDDKPRYLAYVRDAIEAFRKNEEPAETEVADLCEYITALAAYEKSQEAPRKFQLLDIRTPEEYVFIGHPEAARNIPVMFMGYTYDEKMGRQAMLPNAEFAAEVQQHYSPDDHLAILGESGPRAAMAVRILSKSGFNHLYAVTHGFVGEKQGQADHPDYGKRRVNGWVNEGVPWTTALVPELMYDRQKEIADR
jgi:thioredoxin 1